MTIPQNLSELKALKQWVNYLRIWNPTKNAGAGGYDKPPISAATLWNANTTRPQDWTTYDTAAANVGKMAHCKLQKTGETVTAPVDGCGFVLGAGYCGVDLDDVIDSAGNVEPWALEVVERLDTYTEISPSGNGLHSILFCGDLLAAGQNFGRQFPLTKDGKPADKENKAAELEVYFYTNGGRYLTVTGNVFHDKPINKTKGAELRKLFEEYQAAADAHKAAQRPSASVETYNTTGRAATGEDDRRMIESALKAIDPSTLDFGSWAAIGSALKQLGYSCDTWEDWSAGGGNQKHVSKYTYKRWKKLKSVDEPARLIVGIAKKFGWSAAEAFDDEARSEYGRSLYTEEQRKEYGRRKHKEQIKAYWSHGRDEFQRRGTKQAGGGSDPRQHEPTNDTKHKVTPADLRAWMNERRANNEAK